MKTKLVLWGYNEKEEKVLIALQLKPKDNKVDIWTFPETVATDEFARQLMGDWRNDKEVAFPDGNVHTERELSVTESLLPADLKVERGDIVQRAQTEWHFVVLSSKLNDVYKNELSDLQDKVAKLTAYSSDVWEDLKGFWGKVQDQVKERNLLREHADILRDETNVLFGKLKELRSALDDQFREMSKGHMDSFMSKLDAIDKNVADGVRLPAVFDQLKSLQRNFREIKLTREHRSKIWSRLDGAFKTVKEKRFGPEANSESSATERLTRRYKGLMGAIEKMDRSIARDEDELNFQRKRINNTDGQLEAQLRQAKIGMTEERVRSKKEKFEEMLKTKEDLERRIASQKDKDAKRQEKKELEAAKAAAKEKIANEIKNQAEARKDTDGKLEKAAESIVSPKTTAAGLATAGAVVKKASETTEQEQDIEVTEAMFDKMKVVPEKTVEASEAKEATVEVKEAVVEKASEAKEAVADKMEAAKEATVEVKEAVVEKASEAKEAVADKMEATKETTAEVKEAVVEKASEAKEAVANKVEAAKETTTEVKEAVAEKASEAKEAVANKMEAAKETTAEVKEAVVEKTSEAKEAVADKVEDITTGISSTAKAVGGMILGAGAAALSTLKGDETDTTKADEATSSVDTESSGESVLEQASDVMEDITDSLSSTFKAGAAALFGAGAAAASTLDGDDATVSTENKETTTDIKTGEAAAESPVDKVADVVEDITEAATSTLKSAAGALFGLGAATASKLSGEDETKEGSDNVVDDASSISEIVDKVTDSDDV